MPQVRPIDRRGSSDKPHGEMFPNVHFCVNELTSSREDSTVMKSQNDVLRRMRHFSLVDSRIRRTNPLSNSPAASLETARGSW
ncbi:unnamed protein product, partial [Laminaria digitata]